MIKAIERYDSYEDSNIEWIDKLPSDWEVKRLKEILCEVVYGTSEKTKEIGKYEVLGMGDIDEGRISFPKKRFIDDVPKELLLKRGDLLFNRTNSLALVGKVGLIEEDLKDITFASYLIRLKVKNSQLSRYFWYFLNSEYFITHSRSNAIQTANQANLSSSKLKQFKIIHIPLGLQKTIAHYLDTKTAQIDRKIDLLTQKATQYSDLKQSLINETVTRGLDKSAPMKDSGVEWIGEVPKHWETRRINDIAIQSKKKNTGLIENNLLSLSYGKIKRRDIDTSFGLLPESFETYQIVEAGNIILRLTDLQNDQRSLRVGLATERGIITSAYLCLSFLRNVYPIFAYYLLFVYDISKVFYWFGGGLRQSMKFDDIKVFPFILPPLSEQKAIADYLDIKTAQIDQIIETINTQIEKLKELRKTLINDVVTGKIKVSQDL